MQLRPFRGLRPPAARVRDVASVPYDVVNTEEARQLAAGNPFSLLHVSRPEIDLPPGTDLHADEVYAKGRENLDRLTREVPLTYDEKPCLYVYRQVMDSHSQTGVVGCCAVDDYDTGIIKKHERTRKDKEDDRTRHILTLSAQKGPVFLTYRGDPAIDALVAQITATEPVYDFVAADGVAHTLWKPDDPAPLATAFAGVPRAYIADGHHRAASASRARAVRRDANPGHGGTEEYNYFLSVLFPAEQLTILPYNRVIKDLGGRTSSSACRTPQELLAALAKGFVLTPNAPPSPAHRGGTSMYLAGKWTGIQFAAHSGGGPIAGLDVSKLQEQVLAPLIGIADPRTDKRIDFVGGIRGTGELEKLVDSGQAAVAFSLFPTTVEDLMAIADAGEIMPPKSTWFEPKLRSGLVIHSI